MTNRRAWTIGIFAYVGLLGALLQLRGALLASFGETFEVTEGQLGLIASAGSVGLLVAILAVGMTASRLDVKRVLVGGLLALAALVAMIASAPTYTVLLVAFLLAGVAQGCLNGLDRPVLSQFYPSSRGRIYNRQEMAWATGATLGPLVASLALALAGWRLAYYLLALSLLPIAVLFLRLEAPSLEDEQVLTVTDLGGLLRTPAVGTMGALMFLLSLVESGLFTWLPYYVGQSMPRGVANLTLSIYLAAYIPGRYTFSIAAERMDNLVLVLGSAVLATGSLVVFVLVGGYTMIGVIFVVGFLVSGMFPTLLAWATNVVPEYSGPVNALAFAASGIGFMLFPAAMGLLAEWYSLEVAMWTLALAMGLFAVLAGGISFRRTW